MNKTIPSPTQPPSKISGHLNFWRCVLGIVACSAVVTGLKAESPLPAAGPLFAEATSQFKAMTTTRYQHKTEVDKKTGSYRYDCVGFVSYAMKQAAPKARETAFKALEIKSGRIPTPAKYMTFFKSLPSTPQPGWQAVTKVSELRPGDVVAWERVTETSNGHAVVIASVPVAGPEGIWVVKVYDSTASPHAEDSRPKDARAEELATSGKRCGLGHGVMALTADPTTGALTGYRWTPKSKTMTVPIAAGRPTS